MEEEKGPRKKKRGRTALIVLGVLVVVGLILHWPTESGFTISRETTYITGPLNPDGTINYVAALNEMMSKGVTGENNAAPLLIRALGPSVLDVRIRERLLKLLGIEDLPENGDYFVPFAEHLEMAPAQPSTRTAASYAAWESPQEIVEALGKRPWSSRERPDVAAWLKANENPLAMAAQATKRPRYCLPWVSESSNPRLLKSLTVFPPYLTLAEALSARAMLRLDGGDVDGATADLLAVHRLARLLAQPPLLLNKLVALAMEESAPQGTIALANSGRLAADQARRMLLELNTLGPMPDVIDAIDHGERFFMLDCVMQLYAGGNLDRKVSGLLASRKYYGTAIDWDRMMRNFNRWYDRIVAAVRESNPHKRDEAVNGLISEVRRMNDREPAAIIKLILGRLGGRASKAVMTDALSNVFIRLMVPLFRGLADSRYRAVVRYDLARVALALAAFRAEKDEYPAMLSALAPDYMKAVPQDSFTNKPLIYKRDGKGYLLYSLGPNMTDDGGVEDEATGKDDIAVRAK